MIFEIFLTGFALLFVAIVVNLIANRFKFTTWYVFLNDVKRVGLKKSSFKQEFASIIFLFLIYPLILGIVAHLSFHLLGAL